MNKFKIIKIVSRDKEKCFKEIKVKPIIYKGEEFGFALKKYNLWLNCIYIKAGLGFHTEQDNIEGIKKVEKRLGDKFWKTIKLQKPVEENIKKQCEDKKKEEEYPIKKEFLSEKLGFPIKEDWEYSLITGRRHVDMFDVEIQLKVRHGYNDDGESIKQFVERRFGKDVAKLLKELI